MIRLLLYGFIIYVVYRLWKSWAKSISGPGGDMDSVARSDNTELIRDPQCGTYFLRRQGVETRVDGQKLFFCSEQCREAYIREHKLSLAADLYGGFFLKFFIDTANLSEIREAHSLGVLDGVTTNPTLISRENISTRDAFQKHIKTICEIVGGPVSAECVSSSAEDLVAEARTLAAIDPHVVVKVPMTTDGMKAVRRLSEEGIKTNVTLVFSPLQGLMAAKAGATYVSPFVGRLDDVSHEGMQLVEELLDVFSNYLFETEIIVASIRNPLHVLAAAKLGADIATIPFKVIDQLARHPLTDAGIRSFLEDWQKVEKTLK